MADFNNDIEEDHKVEDFNIISEKPEFMAMQRGSGGGGGVAISHFAPHSSDHFAPASSSCHSHAFNFGAAATDYSTMMSVINNTSSYKSTAAAAPTKSRPFIITHSNLTLDQIPSVSGVPIRRQFFPPRKFLAPSHFESSRSWEEIELEVSGYFRSRQVEFCLPLTTAVFSVQGTSADPSLLFDIHVSPTGAGTFIIEFRRNRGDAFILSKMFFELRSILSDFQEEEEQEEEEDGMEDGLGAFASSQYVVHASDYLNFDALIK